MAAYNLAVLPGDGIGPEITREAVKVLDSVGKRFGHRFVYNFADFGGIAFDRHGHPFPDVTKAICDAADAIIKGPIGGPKYDTLEDVMMRPEKGALLPLRARYDTFANFRPVVLPASCAGFSPLRADRIGKGLDILMMRELVGGSYFGEKVEGQDTGMAYARDDCHYTRNQIERFAHVCFREAMGKNGRLTSVHKANVLATSRFWNLIFQEVAKGYPGVNMSSMLVDNVAFQLVVNPTQFNGVMAFENMQGDILTDQAGGVLGSLGLMPSACLNPETGKGYYEPAHGSAPDIAGKGIANPYSMIGSVALMLEKSFGLKKEANAVWAALTAVFAKGYRTAELAGREGTPLEKIVGTAKFGELVAGDILAVKA